MYAYLKVYGLNQYARAFAEIGLADLEAIARLSETEALEFLERLRVYPGHRLRLLRAIDCLRHALIGAERRDVAQTLEDDAALERLCVKNDELSKEKHEREDANSRLQSENHRLLGVVQQQDTQLQRALSRIQELEELVQAQTEQVSFLAEQLQIVSQGCPMKQAQLYQSYRDSHVENILNLENLDRLENSGDDWADAQKVHLPEITSLPQEADAESKLDTTGRGFSKADFHRAVEAGAAQLAVPASAPGKSRSNVVAQHPPQSPSGAAAQQQTRGPQEQEGSFFPTGRAKMAQTLDSAKVRECLAGFDVDHIIRCLASALQNKIILSVAKSRPHNATPQKLEECSIFIEPGCLERLRRLHTQQQQQQQLKGIEQLGEGASPLSSFCSALMSQNAGLTLKDSMGRPADPLNILAVREVPNKWDIYGFLRDVMVNFRLEPEVSVLTLFYLDRFSELSGVALTPDNWRRLVIAAMMLASKVWNDESFENIEFAQLCPLYSIDEINRFEMIFLKSVGYNMAVKGSQYAKTYFLLRTLGAKDSADFVLDPMDAKRATRLAERCLEKQIEFRERYPDDGGMNAMNWTM